MKITIFAAGSRGDIQPCVVLGKGLQRTGYSIRLAVPENFSSFILDHGLDFYPLHGDIQDIMAGETGRNFMESGGGNIVKSIRSMRVMIAPIVNQMISDAYEACLDADAIICLGVLAGFGKSISEALQIPLILIEPTPLLPSKSFAAASWPIQKDMGRLLNHFSGIAMLQVVWQWYKPFINDFRTHLGFSKYSFRDFYHVLRTTPMIGAYSPNVIPNTPQWLDSLHITGYLYLDHEMDWQPSQELIDFLNRGSPPVYIGFGSMAGTNPEQLANLVFESLELTGQRGILVTGWGGLRPENVPENVFILKSAPHKWLFPRMSALVHHGGAGTTAEGLRSGVPMVIVPFLFDQPFWGERIRALGLGPAPIQQKKLTSSRLAEAIQVATSNETLIDRAKAMGEAISSENGIDNAVEIIRRLLN